VKGYGLKFRMREWRWKLAGHHHRRLPAGFSEPLRGAAALEIGGPSAIFGRKGLLPVYGVLGSVDGCNFAAETIWGQHADQVYRPEGNGPRGRLWIMEAAELGAIGDDSYDAVLASHVIEHIANPLAALEQWRRVVRPGGHVLLVVPHKEGTFDHRRPVTPLSHMVEDYRRGTGEDDTTHLTEVLELHDLVRSPELRGAEHLAQRARDNPRDRSMHHHVFTTRSSLALLDRAGLEIREIEARWRHDIFVLCREPGDGERPDNGRFFASDARWLRRSPFRADRQEAV
jgi:SAM-dependent methyltransferase